MASTTGKGSTTPPPTERTASLSPSALHSRVDEPDRAARPWAIFFAICFTLAVTAYLQSNDDMYKLQAIATAPISAVGVYVMGRRAWPSLGNPHTTSLWIIISGGLSMLMLLQYLRRLEAARLALCSPRVAN